MKVLIVSKTRMHSNACVGGIVLDTNQSVRLLQPGNLNQPMNTPYEVGQVWELTFYPRPDLEPPHVEDVVVHQSSQDGQVNNLAVFLRQRFQPWLGSPNNLYDGFIASTHNGSGYISDATGIPNCSTGFWLSDKPLTLSSEGNKVRYHYPSFSGVRVLTYVGYDTPIGLPANTLTRVSLARWWRPGDAQDLEERCYLQLSGWYS